MMRYVGSTDDGYRGKTIFRKRWFDKWSIQRIPQHVKAARPYESVLGHQCRRFGRVYYFSMYPGDNEVCWVCKKPIPENLIGIWKLHNWEIFTQLGNETRTSGNNNGWFGYKAGQSTTGHLNIFIGHNAGNLKEN